MITFVCSGCGQQLNIGDEWAGLLGHCPACDTNSRVPGNPKRTSKLTIILRMLLLPMIIMGGFASVFCIISLASGLFVILAALAGCLGVIAFMWGGMNAIAYIINPKYYRLWKKGGGDPFFDTAPPIINNDPDSTRYQEMYREQQKQDGIK